MFVKIGNSLVTHPSYVGDILDRKQNPTKLDKTSSNEIESQMEACWSLFLYFLPASQLYLIFLATSRKKQHAELEKQIDEDMALNSDNDINNKRNPDKDSSSDGSSEIIPKRKKQRTSRVSKGQLLLELIEKTAESREKARAEREKVKAKQYEDHMVLESRKLDAMILLIQRALPEEKSQKKNKKSKSKKESDSSSTDND